MSAAETGLARRMSTVSQIYHGVNYSDDEWGSNGTYDGFYVGHKVVKVDESQFSFKVGIFAQMASCVAATSVRERYRVAHNACLFSARKDS